MAMLIDQYLPYYDATEVQQLQVDAPPEVTYGAIRETDLTDPEVKALFAIRELPDRLARRWQGEPPRDVPERCTFGDLLKSEMGWVLLDEEPGIEFVVGSVGRFWRRDYGWKPVPPDQFVAFGEPGYAKIALSFRVEPTEEGESLLRYEARTAATNEAARKRFLRYWRLIHLGVAIVMRRALERIREEAERRGALTPASPR
jgi:hypothetical protein